MRTCLIPVLACLVIALGQDSSRRFLPRGKTELLFLFLLLSSRVQHVLMWYPLYSPTGTPLPARGISLLDGALPHANHKQDATTLSTVDGTEVTSMLLPLSEACFAPPPRDRRATGKL